MELAESLFARMLRGYDCGAHIVAPPYSLSDVSFPVIPQEDVDHRLAVLSETELAVLRLFLERTLALEGVRFTHPPQLATSSLSAEDVPWDTWVRQAGGDLVHADLGGLLRPQLVSFIG